jgi:hypothetical protein
VCIVVKRCASFVFEMLLARNSVFCENKVQLLKSHATRLKEKTRRGLGGGQLRQSDSEFFLLRSMTPKDRKAHEEPKPNTNTLMKYLSACLCP